MSDDLIGTAAVAELLGVSVATVNRWGADDTHELKPALTIPGPARAAARLYRRSDVEAYGRKRSKTERVAS